MGRFANKWKDTADSISWLNTRKTPALVGITSVSPSLPLTKSAAVARSASICTYEFKKKRH